MSQEDVEVVRYAAWERGDFGSVDWAHPEIEFVIADGPELGRWSGVAAIEGPWREFLSTWDEYRTEADEYRVLDGERVLVLVRFSGHGKTSGLELAEIATRSQQTCSTSATAR